jgi:hypothetical protein
VVNLKEPLERLLVPKRSKVVMPHPSAPPIRVATEVTAYQLCFQSRDHQVYLYSESGQSLKFLDDRDTVHPMLAGNHLGVKPPFNYFVRVEEGTKL